MVMAAKRLEAFLLSRSVHALYSLTKEELCVEVPGRVEVQEKEEMQVELKKKKMLLWRVADLKMMVMEVRVMIERGQREVLG